MVAGHRATKRRAITAAEQEKDEEKEKGKKRLQMKKQRDVRDKIAINERIS